MTRVYVIDPELVPTGDTARRGGLRIMECDIIGWQSGRIVRVAIYGDTAIPAIGKAREHLGPIHRIERWRVFEDIHVGSWVAWVIRPDDDRRSARDIREARKDLLLIAATVLLGLAMAAVAVLFTQCSIGGNIG